MLSKLITILVLPFVLVFAILADILGVDVTEGL